MNGGYVCSSLERRIRYPVFDCTEMCAKLINAPEILYYRFLIITTRSKQTILFKAVDCPVELQV